MCFRYRDFRYPPEHPRQYEYTVYYWHVIAAKMAFIIVVEVSMNITGNETSVWKHELLKHINGGVSFSTQHIVYLTKFILSYVIPDVPYAVKEQIRREKYLTQVILHETNLKLVTKRLKPAGDEALKHREVNASREELELDF